ncbi:MAG: hypothetical protein ACFBRM_10550 [Pikeienuella sp.]
MPRRQIVPIFFLAAAICAGGATPALSETSRRCFVGQDAGGGAVRMALEEFRARHFWEYTGRVSSTTAGVWQIKADGHSGAGRIFKRHEYDNTARFIQLTRRGEGVSLAVEGWGTVILGPTRC